MNILCLTGHIGRSAETRFTASGEPITSFSVALTSGYGDKKVTTWLNCSCWGKRYESLAQYLVKGAQVAITGEFAARAYKDKEGADKLSLDLKVNDLTLLGKRDADSESTPTKPAKAAQQADDFGDVPF